MGLRSDIILYRYELNPLDDLNYLAAPSTNIGARSMIKTDIKGI
jgi:hypothetical protein